jgi:pyridoxal phosphate enzyme (YggS family)
VAELISGLRSETICANLERVRSEIAAAVVERRGRGLSDGAAGGEGDRPDRGAAGGEGDPPTRAQGVEVLAATKYVALEDLPILAEAGIRVVGENRAQDLQAKAAAHGELFEWDFIGQLQSRRVRSIVPHVRLIHSVASESALRELGRHRELARPGLRILVEVNVAGEAGKAGVAPEELDSFIARSPVPVAGLMTMPPLSSDPGRSRPWFAALREMARERGLEHLSMGTSQDYVVAAEEGATIVRIGTKLYHPQPWEAACPPRE